MSKYDKVHMDEEDQKRLEQYKADYAAASAAGDEAGKKAAHDGAEALRAGYGYSGGGDGGDYIPTGTSQPSGTGSGGKAPEYVSRYQDQIDALTGRILTRPGFTYDPETDPVYQQYREQYTRAGERAMEDTLGKVSARTGGLASSYAGTAAQQAYDGYMEALADKIPELRQLAYSMYQQEDSGLRSDLALLRALEEGDYSRYQDEVSRYNSDRSFAYNAEQEAADRAYTEQRYADSQAADRAETLAAYGDFSGYKALGYSEEEIARMQAAWEAAQKPRGSASSGGSASGGSSWASETQKGIIRTMLGMGTEYEAYEYLLRQGYTNSQVENMWQMYQEEKAEQLRAERPSFSDLKRTVGLLLAQGQDEKAVKENEKWWSSWNKKQQEELRTMLSRYGY